MDTRYYAHVYKYFRLYVWNNHLIGLLIGFFVGLLNNGLFEGGLEFTAFVERIMVGILEIPIVGDLLGISDGTFVFWKYGDVVGNFVIWGDGCIVGTWVTLAVRCAVGALVVLMEGKLVTLDVDKTVGWLEFLLL